MAKVIKFHLELIYKSIHLNEIFLFVLTSTIMYIKYI